MKEIDERKKIWKWKIERHVEEKERWKKHKREKGTRKDKNREKDERKMKERKTWGRGKTFNKHVA